MTSEDHFNFNFELFVTEFIADSWRSDMMYELASSLGPQGGILDRVVSSEMWQE